MNRLEFILSEGKIKRPLIVNESINSNGGKIRCWQDAEDASMYHIEMELKPYPDWIDVTMDFGV